MGIGSSMAMAFDIFGHDKTASKALTSVGNKADQTGSKLTGMGKMGKAGGLLLATGVGAAAAGAVVAGKALLDMGKSAAEDVAGQKQLALALKNSTGARKSDVAGVEDWISKQGVALGVTDDQLRPALSRLARSTKDVSEAQSLASLAMDASAGTGKSLESVTSALAKAHDGSTGALAKLGIQTKDAEGKALSFEQITKNMAGTFKGAASEGAGTLEGKMGRLRLAFDEAKESAGAKLLPVGEKLADWALNKMIPAAQELGARIMPKLKEAWAKVSAAFEDAKPGLMILWDGLKGLAKVIADKVAPVVIKLYSTYLSGLLKGLGKVGEFMPTLASSLLRFAASGVKAFRSLYTGVTGVLEGILTVAEKTLGWIPGIGDKIKTAKAGFSSWRDDTITKLDDVERGLKKAARSVDAYGERARQVKKAKIEADISDLEAKILKSKTKLNDPDLSKTRRAKLEADISDLEAKADKAKSKLDAIKGKKVTVGVAVAFTRSGKSYVRMPPGSQYAGKAFPLASGGIVRRRPGGIIANIGEGRYDEAVVPLPRGGLGALGGGELHAHFHNPIIGSKEDLARYITSAQQDYKRRTGVKLGLA